MSKNNIKKLAENCKAATSQLATLSTQEKNRILREMAKNLKSHLALILKENKKDLIKAQKNKLSSALTDRLTLNKKRIFEMAQGLIEVSKLKDPVGQITKQYKRPNGLIIKKTRIPLGVVGIIYESRPNVTVDAAGLCFKSGNAVFLRGGSEAFYSNLVLGKILQKTLIQNKLSPHLITVVPTTNREALKQILTLTRFIDVIIPRGGRSLMTFMESNSHIPIIKHDQGICNIFVDESASIKKAVSIIENAKVQRPGVCNAVENLFVHQKIAKEFLPHLSSVLLKDGVEIRGDDKVRQIIKESKKASIQDLNTEYLDLILTIKIVKDVNEAILLIRKHGSCHTESILTQNKKNADSFIKNLDSSCVMVNASTRFNDGGQLGLGAEIGISTTKLHAYGPMGLEELTTQKYIVLGNGQIRL